MRTLIAGAVMMTGALALSSTADAQAFRPDTGFTKQSPVTEVRYGGGFRGGGYGGRGFGGRGFGRGYGGGYGRGYGRGFGYGFGGLAAGALIGGALASGPYSGGYNGYYGYGGYPYYGYSSGYYPSTVYQTETINDDSYCIRRYRSYDPASGTYLGNDGRRHAC